MTITQLFSPDPAWYVLALGAGAALAAAWLLNRRGRGSASRRLLTLGVVLGAALLAYSLIAAWLLPTPRAA